MIVGVSGMEARLPYPLLGPLGSADDLRKEGGVAPQTSCWALPLGRGDLCGESLVSVSFPGHGALVSHGARVSLCRGGNGSSPR